jgi:peptidoglycan L-alanyl-D-glutamate endopeptidase CwlK
VSLSKASEARLSTCHPELQRLFRAVAEEREIVVVEGHRAPARQREKYNEGLTLALHGPHNDRPARAADVAPKPLNWGDIEAFRELGAFVLRKAEEMGIKVRWGGNFRKRNAKGELVPFFDGPHYELL